MNERPQKSFAENIAAIVGYGLWCMFLVKLWVLMSAATEALRKYAN